MNADMIPFGQLEQAAHAVLKCLNQLPQYGKNWVGVMGGMAAAAHLGQEYRGTDNVDFITDIGGSPYTVQQALRGWPCFSMDAHYFFYMPPGGSKIRIKFYPSEAVPFLPLGVSAIGEFDPARIPYVAHVDLIILKLGVWGLRHYDDEKSKDVRDSKQLAFSLCRKLGGERSGIERQRMSLVRRGLDDMGSTPSMSRKWWMALFFEEERVMEIVE